MIRLSFTPAQLGLITGALRILRDDRELQRRRGLTSHQAAEALRLFLAARAGQAIAFTVDLGRVLQLEMREFIAATKHPSRRTAWRVIDAIEDKL